MPGLPGPSPLYGGGDLLSAAESVRDRLKLLAQRRKDNFQVVLSRYAVERFLARLSRSKHADRFIVKGASLFFLWLPEVSYHRITRDLDLLGPGQLDEEELKTLVGELCQMESEDEDGLLFDPATVTTRAIRPENKYGGTRVTLDVHLLNIRIPLQIDVGLGDSVSPPAVLCEFPTLLSQEHPKLRAYQRETAIAEKLHALVELGLLNSRLKDYFDIAILARTFTFDALVLWEAILKTFERRNLGVPDTVPPAMTKTFLEPSKQAQWKGFVRKRVRSEHRDWTLEGVVDETRDFLWPVLKAHGRLKAWWDPERREWR